MRREVTLEEISDGRLYDANDMVKADCQDCKGCHDCCTGMGDSVLLDPYDVCRLSRGLRKIPEELIGSVLELGISDGNVLPHLAMRGTEEKCVFLNQEGRCSIHEIRPGFCRLFPLGRYYTEDGFKYIIQIHECAKKNRSKIKVKKMDRHTGPQTIRKICMGLASVSSGCTGSVLPDGRCGSDQKSEYVCAQPFLYKII